MVTTPQQIIGIHGRAGAGKDTIADYLHNNFKYTYIESFADPLKYAAANAFGIPVEQFYDRKMKEEKNEYWGVSPREIAQFMGTEMFRDIVGKLIPEAGSDFWVKRMAGLLSGNLRLESDGDYNGSDSIVIPDLRFQNEYDWIASVPRSIIIIVRRKGANGDVGLSSHRSEQGINITHSDKTFIIENDGTIPDLFSKVDQVLDSQTLISLQRKGVLNV